MQILSVVQKMGQYTPVECFFAGKDSWQRGMPKLTQQIVIGTPGTMIDVCLFLSCWSVASHRLAVAADGYEGSRAGLEGGQGVCFG